MSTNEAAFGEKLVEKYPCLKWIRVSEGLYSTPLDPFIITVNYADDAKLFDREHRPELASIRLPGLYEKVQRLFPYTDAINRAMKILEAL